MTPAAPDQPLPVVPAPAAQPPPGPPRRWLAWTGLALGLVLVLGVLGLAGVRWWLGRYLHSDQFRRLVSTHTANALQAEGEYLPFHWSANTAYTDGFAARGRPGSLLQQLRADQIRAEIDLTGWLEPRWRIRHLQVQRINATFQIPDLLGGGPTATSPADSAAGSRQRLDLGPIQVQELNLAWPMTTGRTATVHRVQATLERSTDGWELAAQGGQLRHPDWPSLHLQRAQIQLSAGTIHLKQSAVSLADGGQFAVTGEWPLAPARPVDLQLNFAEVPIRNWVPPDWRGALNGRAQGSARVRGVGDESVAATGTVQVLGAKLEALPILERIALFTQTEQFRSIQLQKASAQVALEAGRLRLSQVLLESPGLLRIEGGCQLADQQLDGEFDLGVAASSLKWLPGARQRVFTVDRDGYLWTKVRVRGPLDNLQEDLSARLLTAAGQQVIETGTGLLEQGAKTFLDLLK